MKILKEAYTGKKVSFIKLCKEGMPINRNMESIEEQETVKCIS
jgi:hypothetical protein